MSKIDIELKKCITPEFRVSYPAVFQPKKFEGQEKEKYGVTMVFAPGENLKALMRAHDNAGMEKWGPDKKKWPRFKYPAFREGSVEKPDDPIYEGRIFATASSEYQPDICDAKLQDIIRQSDFYAGCYAKAQVIAYAYDTAGNRGIGFALMALQKTRDGEVIAGRQKASKIFSAIEDDDEDYSSVQTSGDDEDGLFA